MTRGPETADTTRWTVNGDDEVEVWEDSVWPGAHRNSRTLRTITNAEARAEILPLLAKSDDELLAYLEAKWRLTP